MQIKATRTYCEVEDADLLTAIRRLADRWPTYSYRLIAATQSRKAAADSPAVSAKEAHRMGNHASLLEKHTAIGKGRVRDGKVMVMRSTVLGAPTGWSSPAGMAGGGL